MPIILCLPWASVYAICLIAYYPLYVVQRTLHKKGFHHYWNTLHHRFNGQVRATTIMVNDKGYVIRIR